MKIAFLSSHNSIHTVRWVNEMALRGHEVYLITMHPGREKLHPNIQVYKLPFNPPYGYYLNVWHLKKLLRQIKPDILNTHYASGYGTLGRIANFHPNLLSVWGSDVFDFPFKSKINMKIIRKNLKAADRIASTSNIMKKEIESIYKSKKDILITPFGVDCKKFKPIKIEKNDKKIIIGTVKRLDHRYGISTLIKAFTLVKNRVDKRKNIELILIGGGPQKKELKQLVESLGIDDKVQFIGPILHHEVPLYLNSFDIYAALSINESFGVAIIEAAACEVPVVVSDAGGLPEVVINGQTGYIVPRNNPHAAAEKLEILIDNLQQAKAMGKKGRRFVLDHYEWKENASRMECIYEIVTKEYKKRI